MLKCLSRVPSPAARRFSTSKQLNFKVAVVGAAGGIGQPLSMLLKLNKRVKDLRLHDLAKVTPGVAVDLSHIETKSKVQGFVGADKLRDALCGVDVVVCPAGVPRKPGMTRDDLFKTNASIIKDLACAVAESCPKALLAIITNPVNSVVPIAAEVLKAKGVYDAKRLFGVSTLDLVRTRTFIGEAQCADPIKVKVQVIGGHSGITIVPVLSQSEPKFEGSQKEIEALTKRIQDAGTEVVKAKAGGGSATLSMAYAGHRFVNALLRGLKGERKVVECAYVESKVTEVSFFATPVRLGKGGVAENLGLPCLNDYEQKLLKAALPELKKNIQKGVEFVKKG